ncbi:hypothetical protein A9Z40_03010 [Microbacterium arborescens]|uniref:Uncharacterized protein n=1 Tax=Microbacterium arborescens TaxID=33883 RepID=A0ABX2WIM9_9MICO|nr:hypothetical protein [Microbacterium arborescens]OAZ40926.1 hypothetical protein A9Z40_03010 [Microbacterium arborescens]
MTFSLPCITVTRGHGCRVLGEHLTTCRGIRLDGRRAVACDGCLPQPAVRGLLCESCSQRFDAALDRAVDLVTHLRSIERAPVPEGPKTYTKPGPRSILPVSWLTADETWSTLRELAFRADPLEFLDLVKGGTNAYQLGVRASIEQVRDAVELAVDLVRVSSPSLLGSAHTALLAVSFYRQAQRALHMYPFAEEHGALAYATCRDCGNRTLERRPPLQYLDPITVRCVTPGCGAIFHPALVEFDLATYRAALEAA